MTVYFPQRRERRRDADRLVCLSLIILRYIVIYTYICFIEILFVLKSLRSRGKNFKKICYIGCLFVYLGMKLGAYINSVDNTSERLMFNKICAQDHRQGFSTTQAFRRLWINPSGQMHQVEGNMHVVLK